MCQAPHYSPPHPCLVVACKIIYCSANDAHRVGFVVFHNLRNQPESSYALSLPCTHTPLHFSLCHSLRRHARFRAFACVVHIWQHVACRLPQLTNGCLSGENMFLRNFIRLHLVVALLSPSSPGLDAPSWAVLLLNVRLLAFFIAPLFVVAAMAANGVTSLVER